MALQESAGLITVGTNDNAAVEYEGYVNMPSHVLTSRLVYCSYMACSTFTATNIVHLKLIR